MPPQQFKWIDRDTAARDMLQLVYHAPPQIAEQAVKLLKAIRSPAIILELKAIFLDSECDIHLRREVYEAICATRGNFDFSEFESTNLKGFIFHSSFDLLKNHPINATWILRNVETRSTYMQLNDYSKMIEYVPEIVTERILKIVSENENPFDKDLGFRLHKFGGETFKILLDKNWERIIQHWLLDDLEYETEYWQRLRGFKQRNKWLARWPELQEALSYIQLDSLLGHIGLQSPLNQRLICCRLLPYAPKTASELLLKLLDEKQIILDLETAGLLHQYGDEVVQNWLKMQWDELIYLCLIDSIGAGHHAEKVRIVHILENWSELKSSVFQHAPAMIEEYNQKKSEYNTYGEIFQLVSDEAIQQHPSWQAIENRHLEWLKPNKHLSYVARNLYNLDYLTIDSEGDIPLIAAKTYFLGTAVNIDNDSSWWLSHLLLESDDQWRNEWVSEMDGEHLIFAYTPVRFEAGYALRNLPRPDVWKNFIQAFLTPKDMFGAFTNRMFERHMLRWISRMTDMLSGVEPEFPDEELPLNARPWFCALVKQESTTPKV